MDSNNPDVPPAAPLWARSADHVATPIALLPHASSSSSSDASIATTHRPLSWDGLEALQERDPGWANLHPSSRLASENVGMLAIGGESYNHMETPVLMAVSHLAQAVHHHHHDVSSIFPVSELLNAVFNDARPSRRSDASPHRLDDPASSSPPPTGEAHASESEMTDVVSDDEDESVPPRTDLSGGDDEVDSIVRQLGIGLRPTPAADESPVDGADTIGPYSSMTNEELLTTSRVVDGTYGVNDCYPYDNEPYDQDSARSLRDFPTLADVDFDDFYRGYDYNSASQASEPSPPFNGIGQDGHDHGTDEDGLNAGNDPGDPHLSTFDAHGISTCLRHLLSKHDI